MTLRRNGRLLWALIFGALAAATGLTIFALGWLLVTALRPVPAYENGRLSESTTDLQPVSGALTDVLTHSLPPPVVAINTIALPLASEPVTQLALGEDVVETAIRPSQPVTSTAAQLIIPSLNVVQTIRTVPIVNEIWDISQLGGDIGHLSTTGAAPLDALAPALVAHVTSQDGNPGPFYHLTELQQNQEIIYRANGVDYVYKVQRFRYVSPDQVDELYWPNEKGLILATCTSWNYLGQAYDQRLIVRAVFSRLDTTDEEING
ncbi:MAG: class F sortase [Anaerolineales bacterium]|nr:class F sortase [Anaerolineales bacterium]